MYVVFAEKLDAATDAMACLKTAEEVKWITTKEERALEQSEANRQFLIPAERATPSPARNCQIGNWGSQFLKCGGLFAKCQIPAVTYLESQNGEGMTEKFLHLLKAYLAYLPALLTVAGGVLIAVGIFVGEGQAYSSWLRLDGAILAAAGTFWAGHRQITSAAANAARSQKLLDMSEELRSYATGGDSFCYGYPLMVSATQFQWNFIHSGKYPLIDVSVRIHDFRLPIMQSSVSIQLGTLFPGRAHFGMLKGTAARTPAQAFNLFFLSRNGSWTQTIRWVEKPGVQATANRVVWDGKPLGDALLLEISPEYTSPTPADADWPAPAELVKL